MILNETKLNGTKKLDFTNYTTHRRDRDARGGGVAIIIKNCLPHSLLPRLNTAIEQVSVKLWNGAVIAGCYAPPSVNRTNNDLDAIFAQANKTLAMGDFNARHISWKNIINNRNGRTLYEYITTRNIQLLGTPTPTFLHSITQTSSYIDIALNKNIPNLHDLHVQNDLSSDHNPTYLIWKTSLEPEPGPTTWLLKNVDWARFKGELDTAVRINSNIENP